MKDRIGPSRASREASSRRWRAPLAGALLCAALAVPGARAVAAGGDDALALTPAERARIYEETLHLLGGNANVISRWNGEIRFAVLDGGESAAARAVAGATIEEIARLAGLPLRAVGTPAAALGKHLAAARRSERHRLELCEEGSSVRSDAAARAPASPVSETRAEDPRCANFIVTIAPVATMRALAAAVPLRPLYHRALARGDDVYCFFAPFQNGGREIVRAFVYVQSDLPRALLETCLREEMYQSFGLFNDVSGSSFFSFDNRVQPKSITAFDRLLLASLYAPEVRPGAPVFAVADRFMRALDEEGGRGERAR